MKKKYNPFKMWGAWAGAIASVFYLMLATRYFWFDARDILLLIFDGFDPTTGGFISATILSLILGFLLGWGIHALVRAVRK